MLWLTFNGRRGPFLNDLVLSPPVATRSTTWEVPAADIGTSSLFGRAPSPSPPSSSLLFSSLFLSSSVVSLSWPWLVSLLLSNKLQLLSTSTPCNPQEAAFSPWCPRPCPFSGTPSDPAFIFISPLLTIVLVLALVDPFSRIAERAGCFFKHSSGEVGSLFSVRWEVEGQGDEGTWGAVMHQIGLVQWTWKIMSISNDPDAKDEHDGASS